MNSLLRMSLRTKNLPIPASLSRRRRFVTRTPLLRQASRLHSVRATIGTSARCRTRRVGVQSVRPLGAGGTASRRAARDRAERREHGQPGRRLGVATECGSPPSSRGAHGRWRQTMDSRHDPRNHWGTIGLAHCERAARGGIGGPSAQRGRDSLANPQRWAHLEAWLPRSITVRRRCAVPGRNARLAHTRWRRGRRLVGAPHPCQPRRRGEVAGRHGHVRRYGRIDTRRSPVRLRQGRHLFRHSTPRVCRWILFGRLAVSLCECGRWPHLASADPCRYVPPLRMLGRNADLLLGERRSPYRGRHEGRSARLPDERRRPHVACAAGAGDRTGRSEFRRCPPRVGDHRSAGNLSHERRWSPLACPADALRRLTSDDRIRLAFSRLRDRELPPRRPFVGHDRRRRALAAHHRQARVTSPAAQA